MVDVLEGFTVGLELGLLVGVLVGRPEGFIVG